MPLTMANGPRSFAVSIHGHAVVPVPERVHNQGPDHVYDDASDTTESLPSVLDQTPRAGLQCQCIDTPA